mmetsp:Transcript_2657/g.3082  ORF Transcript_2657/g.3082 Transcript_2657/m.3082 type:complete len:150 (-) Transcript_2657:503-952(-)|eukprot:CAMPEP_0170855736 /NCGR_PEP_ID=MMETSP0734-20130129/14095_1 /TAXON_ID=186038 /ORGANISM="Fragilariopsis kerguelensis, Strain L26-C5" /LENGTH=149 /DNA_ID=CAMNT_0011227281 /DNA_START=702 /DNA_END=1151 /DNA_ORIENTATION=+
MAHNQGLPEEGLLLLLLIGVDVGRVVVIVFAEGNGGPQEVQGTEDTGRRGHPQQGHTGTEHGPVVRKLHVRCQHRALEGGDQAKHKKEVAIVAMDGADSSSRSIPPPPVVRLRIRIRPHEIEEVGSAGKDWHGSTNDVKIDLPGGILFR